MATDTLDTLPCRRFLSSEARDSPVDRHGFLAPHLLSDALQVGELFAFQATLISAPPWIGKTYVARRVYQHFQRHMNRKTETAPFGSFFHFTSFHREGFGPGSSPDWWDQWRTGATRACWILDAVDEDERRGQKHAHQILGKVEELRSAERQRLCLLMFVRASEVPVDFRERLQEIYTDSEVGGPSKLSELQLAPLDRQSAQDFVGSDEAFARVCRLIEECKLQAIAGLPCALETLQDCPADTKPTVTRIWHQVLFSLLREKIVETGASHARPAEDDRFDAACRIAAALTFSGQEEIALDRTWPGAPTISDLYPRSTLRFEELRQAAFAAAKTEVFRRTPNGYGFAQRHVQEWLTAFALKDVQLSRLRGLVSDGAERPLAQYGGVLSLLRLTTEHDEVKDWIVKAHGGIPPRSDAAPMGLDEAVGILDRLQELAERSVYGLHFWRDRGLERISAPGLGSILAERLANRSLSLRERYLLIEVAQKIGAVEVAEVAEAIVTDGSEDERLRTSAAYFLRVMVVEAQFERLERVIISARRASREERVTISCLITALWERGHWSLLQAVRYAPEDKGVVADATAMLHHRLNEQMTPDDARELLRRIDWRTLEIAWNGDQRRPLARGSRGDTLLKRAIKLLSSQDPLCDHDYRLLLPPLLSTRDLGDRLLGHVCSAFARSTAARRMLFVAGLDRDTTGRTSRSWFWRTVLTSEDLDWLEDLAGRRSDASPWLWEELLRLCYRDGVLQRTRNRIRRAVRAVDRSIVAAFDAGRRKWLAKERRGKVEQEQRRAAEERRQIRLEDAVRERLAHLKPALPRLMHDLAWICWTDKHTRPENIAGTWEDLDEELRRRVLAMCVEALRRCVPTPIPKENLYPATIIYEAHAFVAVVEQVETFELTGVLIRKWLPSTLIFSMSGDAVAMARCADADREATEDVLLAEIRRGLSMGEDNPRVALNLPTEYWSERLASHAARLVDDEELTLNGRCELLRLLAYQQLECVGEIAEAWLAERPTDAEDRAQCRAAALDALLMMDPDMALAEIARRVAAEGADLLIQLKALPDQFGRGRFADVKSWSASQLEQLCDILHIAFPSGTDTARTGEPTSRGSQVTRRDDIRHLRDDVPPLLFERGRPDDGDALERLAASYTTVRDWYTNACASRAAGEVVASMAAPAKTDAHLRSVPPEDVVRVLEDSGFRLIRSSRDLQLVLLDALKEIAKTAKQHLAMLYLPRRTPSEQREPGGEQPARGASRKRLHEEALQAYLFCRLNDRLRGVVLDRRTRVVVINRETLAPKNQRQDLKVQAPTVAVDMATVVIEVKWSDNLGVASGLTEQLGREYLLGGDLMHGIYLVGWYRERRWRQRGDDPDPRPEASPEAWQEALQRQAARFAASNPAIVIEPLVVDLQWDPDGA